MRTATELAELFDDMMSFSPARTVADFWAERLDRNAASSDFALGLSSMQARLEHVAFAIESADFPARARSLYLEATSALLPFVSAYRVHGLSISNLNERKHHIDVLHLAAAALPSDLVPNINPLTLEALSREVSELLADVDTADITADLKSLIKAQLGTLIMALGSYNVLGYLGVCRVYGAAAAELARTAGLPTTAAPAARNLMRRALTTAKKVGAVVVWAHAVVSGVDGILTDGSSILGLSGDEVAVLPSE